MVGLEALERELQNSIELRNSKNKELEQVKDRLYTYGIPSYEEAELQGKVFELSREINQIENTISSISTEIQNKKKEQEIADQELAATATPVTPPSDGSAIQEKKVTNTPGGTTVETKSMGNGSNLVNTTQEVKSNGDMKVSSDLGTTDIKQNDSNNINQGNSAKSTNGNDSTFTNGLNESASGSSSRVVGNPSEVQNGITEEINREKASIVAGRSGFNDTREEEGLGGIAGILKDIIGYPKAVLEGISKTLEEVATDEDRPKETKGKDLFSSMMDNIEKETKPIVDKWKKAMAEARKERMAALAKNKEEKKKKQLEAIEKMPDSAHKQRLIKAIKEGKLEETYGALNNEHKEKKSTFDQNKYDEEVIKYVDKVLELERKRC